MRTLHVAAVAAAASLAVVAAVAVAKGPEPVQPPPPEPRTVVAHGTGVASVEAPRRRTDGTIGRAVQAARERAYPRAVAVARAEAEALAAAAGLTLGETIGVARDVSPLGYWDQNSGRFGFGRWCGTIRTRRRPEPRRSCQVPREQTIRVTLTVAAP